MRTKFYNFIIADLTLSHALGQFNDAMLGLQNVLAIKQTVKQYGATPSLVELIGQEQLIASMESDGLLTKFFSWLRGLWDKLVGWLRETLGLDRKLVIKVKERCNKLNDSDRINFFDVTPFANSVKQIMESDVDSAAKYATDLVNYAASNAVRTGKDFTASVAPERLEHRMEYLLKDLSNMQDSGHKRAQPAKQAGESIVQIIENVPRLKNKLKDLDTAITKVQPTQITQLAEEPNDLNNFSNAVSSARAAINVIVKLFRTVQMAAVRLAKTWLSDTAELQGSENGSPANNNSPKLLPAGI